MIFEMEEVSVFKPLTTSHYRRCFIDLEGSLKASEGCILQLACVITDWDMNIIGAFMEYFKTDMPISDKEKSIHKITEHFLHENAERMFHEIGDSSPLSADNTMFISFSDFDVLRINEECDKRSIPRFPFGTEAVSINSPLTNGNNYFNAYNLLKGRLAQHTATLTQSDLDNLYDEVVRYVPVKNFRPHDALFDVLVTIDLCRKKVKTC